MLDALRFLRLHRGLLNVRTKVTIISTSPITHPSVRTGLMRCSFSLIFKYVAFVPLPGTTMGALNIMITGVATRKLEVPRSNGALLRRPPAIIQVLSIHALPRFG